VARRFAYSTLVKLQRYFYFNSTYGRYFAPACTSSYSGRRVLLLLDCFTLRRRMRFGWCNLRSWYFSIPSASFPANESFGVLSRTAGEKEPRLETRKLLAATATALLLLEVPCYCCLAGANATAFVATAILQPAICYIDFCGWFFTACCYNDCVTATAGQPVRKLQGWTRGTVKLRAQPLAFRRTRNCYLALRCSSVRPSSRGWAAAGCDLGHMRRGLA